MTAKPSVERVAAAETYPLRHRVLGRGRTPADIATEDDADDDSGHFVIKDGDAVVAAGTVRRRPPPGTNGPGWQIRGMAVEPSLRGRGFGSDVLAAILDHVQQRGGGVVWCRARVRARALYERQGFVVRGDTFEDPVAGTQVFMSCALPGQSSADGLNRSRIEASTPSSDAPSTTFPPSGPTT